VPKEAQLLQPERFDSTHLANQRVILGPYRYAGQYQQRPQAAEGGILKRTWWVYKSKGEWPDTFEYIVQVWDTASKKGKVNAYSVCVTFGWRRPYIYFLDLLRRQMEWPELRRTALQHYLKWQLPILLFEDASQVRTPGLEASLGSFRPAGKGIG
jgi:phage terminase large subunit-like protein